MEVIVRTVKMDAELSAALRIRWVVFVEEQAIDENLERDEFDSVATHVIAESQGEYIGAGRVLSTSEDEIGTARVGRIAVMKPFRRKGIATLILKALETESESQGFVKILLHAQSYTKSLYIKSGYKETGLPFFEAGIEHVTMIKDL